VTSLSPQQAFVQDLERVLTRGDPPSWEGVLLQLCTLLDCAVGTVHLLGADQLLHLQAQRGLPPPLLDRVATIPIGKGMAGIAAERRTPVQVCNLQVDTSGVARPGAKMTRMEGSIACPMLAGDRLRGVLGVAKPVAYDFSAAETRFLMSVGALLARAVVAPV